MKLKTRWQLMKYRGKRLWLWTTLWALAIIMLCQLITVAPTEVASLRFEILFFVVTIVYFFMIVRPFEKKHKEELTKIAKGV